MCCWDCNYWIPSWKVCLICKVWFRSCLAFALLEVIGIGLKIAARIIVAQGILTDSRVVRYEVFSHRTKGFLKAKEVIQVKINHSCPSIQQFGHLFSTVIGSTSKSCLSFLFVVLFDERYQPKVSKDKTVFDSVEKNILGLNVSMHKVQRMQHYHFLVQLLFTLRKVKLLLVIRHFIDKWLT